MIEDLGDLVVRPVQNPKPRAKPGDIEPKHIRANREQIEGLPCQHCSRQIDCKDTTCFLYMAYKRGAVVPVSLVKMTKG